MNLIEIQAQLQAMDDAMFETPEEIATGGGREIPIIDRHVQLATNYFRQRRISAVFDYYDLSAKSACDPTRPAFNFTVDLAGQPTGIMPGMKLSPGQVQTLHRLWLAEKFVREAPPPLIPEEPIEEPAEEPFLPIGG